MVDLERMTRKFLLNEEREAPSVFSYIQALSEILSSFRPSSVKQGHSLTIAQQHLREIKRHTRRLNERVSTLEEQLHVLEETREPNDDD